MVDEDCASAVCNAATGACEDASMVVYVSPNGAMAGNCGQSLPCSLERGLTRLDQAIRILKLAPGEYLPANEVSVGGNAIIHGFGATLHATIVIEPSAQITIQGITLVDGSSPGVISCQTYTGPSSLELERVTLRTAATGVLVSGCTVSIRASHFAIEGSRPIFQVAGPATTVVVDRTLFENTSATAGQGIYADGGIEITNSIFRNLRNPVVHASGAQDDSIISFSTFIDSPITCDGSPMTKYTNNILYTSVGDAIQSATSSPCLFSFNLLASQSQAPSYSLMNKSGDPLFSNVLTADYHLLIGSPAIDAGNPSPAITVDFDGTPRPQGLARDMGAFEYKP